MDTTKFKQTEIIYNDAKEKLQRGEITIEGLKAQLKKLMVQDEKGIYWMIGGKTGKWYYYEGKEWKEGDPYQGEKEEEEVPLEKEYIKESAEPSPETNLFKTSEIETQSRPVSTVNLSDIPAALHVEKKEFIPPKPDQNLMECRQCHSMISKDADFCPVCSANLRPAPPAKEVQKKPDKIAIPDNQWVIKSVNILSLILFLGGLGIIIGAVTGAIFGVFPVLGDFIYNFPEMLRETRTKFTGGLIFALIGGGCGFIVFAILGILSGLIYNLISFIFGGIRIHIKQQ